MRSLEPSLHEYQVEDGDTEFPDFLTRQLITYLGNKRSLLGFIGAGLDMARARLGKHKLILFDVFSGSGVVARYFKRFASKLIVNDIEPYAKVISSCYLANRSEVDEARLRDEHVGIARSLATMPLREGFIRELYAPHNDEHIGPDDRAFYTTRNACFLDTARSYIEELPADRRHFLLAPLLSEASIHANTSGVFKGFYKNRETGRGQFGGIRGHALSRIKGNIELPFPLFSRFESELEIHRDDAVRAATRASDADVAYLDPPYNQHPYGSNYFMLNLLVDYIRPRSISRVSGIPEDWRRSNFNKTRQAREALDALVRIIKAKILLVSFNSEGFITPTDMQDILTPVGKVRTLETRYNTFRGSRNLRGRSTHVSEFLYVVEKA